MNLGWGSSGGGGKHPETHPDTMIEITDENNHFEGTRLNEVLDELFTRGNNVKQDTVTALLSKDNTLPITNESPWASIISEIENMKVPIPMVAGDSIIYTQPTAVTSTGSSYNKMLEFTMNASGTIRVFFTLKNINGASEAYVAKNGIQVGVTRSVSNTSVEFVEDFTVTKGDKLQVYANYSSGINVEVSNFKFGIQVNQPDFFTRNL